MNNVIESKVYYNGAISSDKELKNELNGTISSKGEISGSILEAEINDIISSYQGSISANNDYYNNLTGQISEKGKVSGNLMETFLRGHSAYEIAVMKGYKGTESEWLQSLVGQSAKVTVIENTSQRYVLKIETKDETFITPNLKSEVKRGVDFMTPEDIDVISQEVFDDVLEELDGYVRPLSNSEIDSIFH